MTDTDPRGPVAEIVRFRLAPGVTEAAFLAAARGTGDFVTAARGFRARRLSRDETGTWTDYVEWAGPTEARAAADAFMADPAAAAMMAAFDAASVEMRHEALVWEIAAP